MGPLFTHRIRRLCRDGQGDVALAEVEKALAAFPAKADPHVLHAFVLKCLGEAGAAAGAYAQALQLRKDDANLWFGMGECLEAAGEKNGAFQAYAKTISIDPRHTEAFFRLTTALLKGGFFGKVKERIDAAASSIRKDPRWFLLRAMATFEMGDGQLICNPPPAYRDLVKRHPAAAALRIRALVYDPQVAAAQLLKETQDWDRRFGPAQPASIPLRKPDPDRPLRIGLVNTRMRRHNVGMQQHALMNHRPAASECTLHLYASNDQDDDLTSELKSMADRYISIAGMSGIEAAEIIRADEIDILLDFNEYTNDGRLDIFAQRAAPIQVHYYGNAVTTGLRAMDYRISDAVSEPVGDADTCSAEKIIRLETGYHLYTPPPNIAPLRFHSPVNDRGYITFGGIHHLAKYNDRVLNLYRRILEIIPTARLLLARRHFEDGDTVKIFTERLQNVGLPMDRITLRGDHGKIASLAIWQEVDCVLDSFPFGGDASVVESLYAGVPMITLMGDRLSGRRSASLLTRIGCEEMIALDEEEYVAKALTLASDPARLNQYRSTLHDRVKASPICDHAQTAGLVYQALRKIWQDAVSLQKGTTTDR